jgi:hypothetical protein
MLFLIVGEVGDVIMWNEDFITRWMNRNTLIEEIYTQGEVRTASMYHSYRGIERTEEW